MRPAPSAYAVILNFEQWEMTSRCVDCVITQGVDPACVVIVDNGSGDDSVAQLGARHPGSTVLAMMRNLGYAGGANAGIRHALANSAGLVWILNNDVWFEEGTLQALMKCLDDRRTGLVGGVIHPAADEDSVEAWGGGKVNPWFGTTVRVRSGIQRLDYVAGTCMLLRAEMLRQVGLFDESYFFYLEDVDICFRAKAAGWDLAVAEGAHIVHVGGASSGGRGPRPVWVDRHHARSSGIFLGKYFGRRLVVAVPVRIIAMVGVRLARLQLARIPGIVISLVKGVLSGRQGNAVAAGSG